jgi:2-polyprenyl-3-methyl-5-hydroxy-6-metoxy-1,4-benzoquinol methylase
VNNECPASYSGGETGKQHNAPGSCRFCQNELRHTFVDLGMSPLCQTHIALDQANQMEPFYPLRVFVCEACFLVQLEEIVTPETLFSDYAYFSSYSDTWVEHARRYTRAMIGRFNIGKQSLVVEIASNDGYLLQHFVEQQIPVLGIEPASNVAAVAKKRGIPTTTRFFGTKTAYELAQEGSKADLLLGNNVLAHVPDLNDFVAGMKILLKPTGIITMEFPHLMRLIEQNQFDTIYHEHFSYFSFTTVERIFAAHNLALFDVEELPTHGGSLRIYARHIEDTSKPPTNRVAALRAKEVAAGLTSLKNYFAFADKVHETKRAILEFLIRAKRKGKAITGYGAPGKGNTLLNYCGIRTDFIDYTVDRSPYKQGKLTPGTHIPIYHPDKIKETKPDYLFILPWNLKDEIMRQTAYIRQWGGQFVVPIPEVQIYP